MPLIYCETDRTALNEFQFIQTRYVGASAVSEKVIEWTLENNDRMEAAIINIGLACKELAESDSDIKRIGIESDTDKANGGEMDDLFYLLNPKDKFAAQKAIALNYEYEKYLGRIKTYMMRYDIQIVLQSQNQDYVKYSN